MIGYYVHHHGAGHAARAVAIARRLRHPVTGLSSAPRPADWDGQWLRLPLDNHVQADDREDPTAAGALHWAPLGHPGLRARMARIAGWIEYARPEAMIVDVSVEVTLLTRLLGVPVATVAQPGVRDDSAHQLAYRVADVILGPWPSWADPLVGVERWIDKFRALGALSRFDGRRPPPAPPRAGRSLRVLAFAGRGGGDDGSRRLAEARHVTRGWRWTQLGGPDGRWEPDPWLTLATADVVVTHAGQNAIAEVAAARLPAIVVPEARPYDEQHATAAVLESAGVAIVCRDWPEAEGWPALLEAADRLGGAGWAEWNDGRGAARAAAAIEELAHRGELACAAR